MTTMSVSYDTVLQDVLKDTYQPALRDCLSNYAPVIGKLEEATIKLQGGDALYGSVRKARNASAYFYADDATLQSAGRQKYDKYRVRPVMFLGRIALSKIARLLAQGNASSFVDTLKHEMDNLPLDTYKRLEAAFLSKYQGAILCQVNGAVNADTTVVVDNQLGHVQTRGTDALCEGLYFDSITNLTDGSPNQAASSVTPYVLSITNGTTFEASEAITLVDNDYIVMAGNAWAYSGGYTGHAIEPLFSALDDGTNVATFENIARSGAPFWQALFQNGDGTNYRDLTPRLLIESVLNNYMRTGEYPDVCFGAGSQWLELYDYMEADRSFIADKGGSTKSMEAGTSKVGFRVLEAMIEMKVAPLFPVHSVAMWKTSDIKMGYVSKWGWDEDGGNIFNRSATKLEQEARWFMFGNMVCDRCSTGIHIGLLNGTNGGLMF